jgi:transposase-like protein
MSLRCPKCHTTQACSRTRIGFVKFGQYRRKSDRVRVQRFLCTSCGRHFSKATFDPCYRQLKRQVNQDVFNHLSSGVSQRRLSYLLNLNRKTIKRKLIFLGFQSLLRLRQFNLKFPQAERIEFDDLETFEHTKMKPVSVTLAVESLSRRILGFSVSSMPAKGLLAKKSLRKYGARMDDRNKGRNTLFNYLKGVIAPTAIIKSDQNPHYPGDVLKHFPQATHIAIKGQRGVITAQGELKKIKFDPLFSLNHTCAKLRADINRLIRKTWCTTKKIERLRLHLALYADYHNQSLYNRKRV